MIKQLTASLIDSVYNSRCLVCGHTAAFEPFLCRDCYHRLNFFGETPYSLREQTDSPVTSAAALFEFNTPLKHLLHHLKYQNAPYVGQFLGQQMGEFFRHQDFSRADILVPIPLHPVKLRERGYNQAEMLATGIARVMGIPMKASILKRQRYTQTQTKLGREERQMNIRNAFLAGPDAAKYRHAILIDDVFTTGATTEEAARALRQAGVARVDVLTAATPMVNRHIRFAESVDDFEDPTDM